MTEVHQLFPENEVFEQGRAVVPGFERIMIVCKLHTLVTRQPRTFRQSKCFELRQLFVRKLCWN